MKIKVLLAVLVLGAAAVMLKGFQKTPEAAGTFVRVNGTRFELGGKPYTFFGTNYWYGANLGSTGPGGNRERLLRELDQLASLGIKNLRVVAGSEGPDNEPYRIHPAIQTAPDTYNEDVLKGLDFLLSEMHKRKMVAVMVLTNFWPWSGGMAQYLNWVGEGSIPYPPPHPKGDWDVYQQFTSQFYGNPKAVQMFKHFIKMITLRKNSISGLLYSQDPAIMSWELCNEPRGMKVTEAYNKWIDETSTFIRSFDPNHLITIGSEGDTSDKAYSGIDFVKNHSFRNIDYATAHLWIENWGWYDPMKVETTYGAALEKAKAYLKTHVDYSTLLKKPLVLEEFGIARDNRSYASASGTLMRDRYYGEIFQNVNDYIKTGTPMNGVLFWAWGGEGRAENPGALWQTGNSWIGDPPHELQGWYSIYNSDQSTLSVLKKWSTEINSPEL